MAVPVGEFGESNVESVSSCCATTWCASLVSTAVPGSGLFLSILNNVPGCTW